MLDDPLTEVQIASVGFWVCGRRRRGEDVSGAEMGAIFSSHDWPAHEFRDRKELEEGSLGGDEGVAGVEIDTVEEVGLFVVMGGKDYVVDDSLQHLEWRIRMSSSLDLCNEEELTAFSWSGLFSTDSVSRTCR